MLISFSTKKSNNNFRHHLRLGSVSVSRRYRQHPVEVAIRRTDTKNQATIKQRLILLRFQFFTISLVASRNPIQYVFGPAIFPHFDIQNLHLLLRFVLVHLFLQQLTFDIITQTFIDLQTETNPYLTNNIFQCLTLLRIFSVGAGHGLRKKELILSLFAAD